MGYLFLILGWLGLVSAQLVWIGHGLYQLFTQEVGFWEALMFNGGMWLVQMVVSFLFLVIGVASTNARK